MNIKILSITATLITMIFSSSIALAIQVERSKILYGQPTSEIATEATIELQQDIFKKKTKKQIKRLTLPEKHAYFRSLHRVKCEGKKLKGKKSRKCKRLLRKINRLELRIRETGGIGHVRSEQW